jgi:hypothetical protein
LEVRWELFGVKLTRLGIVGVSIVLILTGLSNVTGASMSGKMLHTWSHDFNSRFFETRDVNQALNSGDNFTVEQTVFATNYSGSAKVDLLEVKATDKGKNRYYSFGWYGGNEVKIKVDTRVVKSVSVDMSKPHTYRLEVTQSDVAFYIDGTPVKDVTGRNISQIIAVNAGGWDKNSTYDLWIDNIKEYWNGKLVKSEDFEDGSDDYYTKNRASGNGNSGEEIAENSQVPEFPFLEPVLDYIYSIIR